MIEITAADFRRACALIVHHRNRNTDGCNAVLQQVNETERIAQLIFGILDLYQQLIPILHTELGITVLNQLIIDMAAREEAENQ
jgi:hypothetical protein